ncbi:hypothetical protein FPV67DRAFT_878883 [Lyophyllum atratum]|nr:hypothetical protein FPV67DRAFT_878883 [Lyophyllum atratum]
MSDEYASNGYDNTLVNESIEDVMPSPPVKERGVQTCDSIKARPEAKQSSSDYDTRNYPAEGDTTSSGGYGSPTNVWSGRAQRGNTTGVGSHQQSKDEGRTQPRGADVKS